MLVNPKLFLFFGLTLIFSLCQAQGKKGEIQTLYYPNGKISAKGAYAKNGLETGLWEFYTPNQYVCWKGNMLPEKLAQPICTPDSNTCLDLTLFGVTGTPDGPWVELGSKGEISQELTLKKGRPDGDWLVYVSWTGVLWERSTWVDGNIREHYIFDTSSGDTTEISYYRGDTTIHIDIENRILDTRYVHIAGKGSEMTSYRQNGTVSRLHIQDFVLQQASTYDYNEEGKLIHLEIIDLVSYETIKDETYE